MMVKKCALCGGKTEEKLVTAENWWGEKLTLIENVPAWVCENCGEQYFDAIVCNELGRLRRNPPLKHRIIEVPVYPYTSAAN
jgi:YgiT-type zinc finger domain-containing protein